MSQYTQTEQRQNTKCYISEVSKRDCIIMGDFNLGNIKCAACTVKLEKLTGVLYDRKIPLRLKLKVYEAIIRPALTYVSECWAMKVTNKRKIATTEMRMFRRILEVSR